MRWFDRKFDFGLAAHRFPGLIERLRGTPARLEERLRATAVDVTMRDGERWSVQENVGHLLDLEPLWYGRVEDLLAGAAELRAADLENRTTHEARHNQSHLDGLLASFRDRRSALVERLETLGPSDLARSAVHPRLGRPMNVVDLCFFVAEHDDHHLARITELGRVLRSG